MIRNIWHYHPPRWKAWRVGRDLTSIVADLGYKPLPLGKHRLHKGSWMNEELHADVMRRTPPYDESDLDWHHDGDMTDADMNCLIAVWSTNHPTEITLLDSGEIFQPDPYQIVVFDNMKCLHRRPKDAPHVRWLFRQRLQCG